MYSQPGFLVLSLAFFCSILDRCECVSAFMAAPLLRYENPLSGCNLGYCKFMLAQIMSFFRQSPCIQSLACKELIGWHQRKPDLVWNTIQIPSAHQLMARIQSSLSKERNKAQCLRGSKTKSNGGNKIMEIDIGRIISQSLNIWLLKMTLLPMKLAASQNWDEEIQRTMFDNRRKYYVTEIVAGHREPYRPVVSLQWTGGCNLYKGEFGGRLWMGR